MARSNPKAAAQGGLPEPSAQVNLYTNAALAENTYRSYRADLKHFNAAVAVWTVDTVKLRRDLPVLAWSKIEGFEERVAGDALRLAGVQVLQLFGDGEGGVQFHGLGNV